MFFKKLASHSTSVRQHEKTHSFAVQLFQKKVVGENGEQSALPKGTVVTLFDIITCVHLA